ncbi:MAG TPA: hypothetical protein VFQ39_06010 [Longimicrobium sp.]|nr:hypothetical protein [Longimicrobium sp.]
MRKLRLDPEALKVESFAAGGGDGRGTVRGNNVTWDSCDPCYPIEPEDSINVCPPAPTQGSTCQGTCGGTCQATCSCGCWNTRAGWTCDPNNTACMPVPEGIGP